MSTNSGSNRPDDKKTNRASLAHSCIQFSANNKLTEIEKRLKIESSFKSTT